MRDLALAEHGGSPGLRDTSDVDRRILHRLT